MKFARLSRFYYIKLLRLKGNPHALALGTALGVFIGITPTMPFHTILILGITFATRSSAIAAIISSWLVCNPLTYLPIYYFSMVIGNAITPYDLNWQKVNYIIQSITSDQSFYESLQAIFNLGYEAIMVMIVGGTVLALPFAFVSYYFSLHLFIKIQLKRKEKQKRI